MPLIIVGLGIKNSLIPDIHKGAPEEKIDISDVKCIDKDLLILHPKEGKWYTGDIPFSGRAIEIHKNGEIKENIGFYNGKKQGKAMYYYIDGSARKEAYFDSNKLDGVARIWSPAPKRILVAESNFIMGVKHGVQSRWYPSGQLFKRTNLNNGQEEGLQQAWRENGKIYVNYEAKNGRIFGLKRSTLCYELEDENLQF